MLFHLLSKLYEHTSVVTVSYTHLDVYKRQTFGNAVLDQAIGATFGDAVLDQTIGATFGNAVLDQDVYKRQREIPRGGQMIID